MYVYVNEGVVEKEVSKLPVCFGNTSNFHLASKEFLEASGWFELVDEVPSIKAYERLSFDGYEVTEGSVSKKYVVSNKSLEDFKSEKIVDLKKQASAKILSEAPEYKQRSAALGLYNEEKTSSIKEAISSVIDEVNLIEENILSAQSLEEADVIEINIFEW